MTFTSYQELLNINIFDNSLDNILIFISIIGLSALIKKTCSYFIRKQVLSFVKSTKHNIDDKIYLSLKKPISYLIYLSTFVFAFTFINLPLNINNFVHIIFKTFFIFIIFYSMHNLIHYFSDSFIKITSTLNKNMGKTINNILTSALKIIIFLIGTISILKEWGIDISGFIASLGLGGLAFALAAKDTASNIFGGILIFSDKPFFIGDWIKTPDVEGIIEEIGLRSTKIRTFAQAYVSIPNANLMNSAIINWTRMGKRRIKMNIGLTYDTNKSQMQTIIKEFKKLLQDDEDINNDTIFIHFSEFNDSSLDIFCYFFTNTTKWGKYMAVKERINFELMTIVEKHNASFAFPSTSLYVEKNV